MTYHGYVQTKYHGPRCVLKRSQDVAGEAGLYLVTPLLLCRVGFSGKPPAGGTTPLSVALCGVVFLEELLMTSSPGV